MYSDTVIMTIVCPICKRADADLDSQGNVLCQDCGFITTAQIEALETQIDCKPSERL